MADMIETIQIDTDFLKKVRRELEACSNVIAYGMPYADQAYCKGANSAIAELDALLAAAPRPEAWQQSEYGDAYQGAHEDKLTWKRRALEADAKLREQDILIDRLASEINGPSFMGEPVLPKQLAQRPVPAQESDPWAPGGTDYDHSIHSNPDAKAWADLFVQTFPGLADKHDLMLGWFANAMMAMHDHMVRQEAPRPVPTAIPISERMTVWFGSMPGSNGKMNWTAILHRGDISAGFTIARSEYYDRVRYDADCVRHLIGELETGPCILDYDGDLQRPAEPDGGAV